MGPVISSTVEINKSEQKVRGVKMLVTLLKFASNHPLHANHANHANQQVGETLKIKVTLFSKFKVTISDCQVEFGVRPFEEVRSCEERSDELGLRNHEERSDDE